MCQRPDLPLTGYTLGVPMGGDLPPQSAAHASKVGDTPAGAETTTPRSTQAPRFVISALRDPGVPGEPGTPLQRVQIAKGWTEGDELRKRVYQVAAIPETAPA